MASRALAICRQNAVGFRKNREKAGTNSEQPTNAAGSAHFLRVATLPRMELKAAAARTRWRGGPCFAGPCAPVQPSAARRRGRGEGEARRGEAKCERAAKAPLELRDAPEANGLELAAAERSRAAAQERSERSIASRGAQPAPLVIVPRESRKQWRHGKRRTSSSRRRRRSATTPQSDTTRHDATVSCRVDAGNPTSVDSSSRNS
jgi:hypothetical protein